MSPINVLAVLVFWSLPKERFTRLFSEVLLVDAPLFVFLVFIALRLLSAPKAATMTTDTRETVSFFCRQFARYFYSNDLITLASYLFLCIHVVP